MSELQRTTIFFTISLVFLVTGILKLLGNELEVERFINWGYPIWLMYATAVVNILAAIGLMIKKWRRVAAASLVVLLVSAILTMVIHHEKPLAPFYPATILLLLITTLYYESKKNTHLSRSSRWPGLQ